MERIRCACVLSRDGGVDNAQALRACGPFGPRGFESHSRRLHSDEFPVIFLVRCQNGYNLAILCYAVGEFASYAVFKLRKML